MAGRPGGFQRPPPKNPSVWSASANNNLELAKSGRAGCMDSVCKKENIKIQKDTLRFGVWMDLDREASGSGHGSFKWKHW
jgi:hypothetical protein